MKKKFKLSKIEFLILLELAGHIFQTKYQFNLVAAEQIDEL